MMFVCSGGEVWIKFFLDGNIVSVCIDLRNMWLLFYYVDVCLYVYKEIVFFF